MTSTARIYENAQKAFAEWCIGRQVEPIPTHEDIARYLEHCIVTRGASSANVHLSALAALYRASNRVLDTKHPAIQNAMFKSRRRHKFTPSKAKAIESDTQSKHMILPSPNHAGANLRITFPITDRTNRPGVNFDMLWPTQSTNLPTNEQGMTRLAFGVMNRHQIHELHSLLTDFLWNYPADEITD